MVYTNKYVIRGQERHYRAVKIMDYFFRNFGNDNEARWNFIERYFRGEDVEDEIDNAIIVKTETSKIKLIEECIDSESDSYSLEEYENWEQVIDNVLEEEKYRYFCNLFKKNNIRVADYAYTDLKLKNGNIPTLFIFEKENIIILPDNYTQKQLLQCKENGWSVIPIKEVENYISTIKGE